MCDSFFKTVTARGLVNGSLPRLQAWEGWSIAEVLKNELLIIRVLIDIPRY